ncbi:sugar phosphate nucleotidyltransferase [Chloroflexota bacterium]
MSVLAMQVAILAGGLATRLGELTRNQPKSTLNIRGKTFLEYQLELLRRGGIKDIVLCVGHMGEQIERHCGNGKKYGLNIKYSAEDKPLSTAGALKKAESLLNDTFFTMYGDSYLFLDFGLIMNYYQSQNKLALMTVYKNYDRYGISNTEVEGNLVRQFSKKEKTEDMVYIEYGVNIFQKEALKMVPKNQFCPLDDLFHRLIEMEELLAFEVKDRFYEVGSPEGLKEFEEYIREENDTF